MTGRVGQTAGKPAGPQGQDAPSRAEVKSVDLGEKGLDAAGNRMPCCPAAKWRLTPRAADPAAPWPCVLGGEWGVDTGRVLRAGPPGWRCGPVCAWGAPCPPPHTPSHRASPAPVQTRLLHRCLRARSPDARWTLVQGSCQLLLPSLLRAGSGLCGGRAGAKSLGARAVLGRPRLLTVPEWLSGAARLGWAVGGPLCWLWGLLSVS